MHLRCVDIPMLSGNVIIVHRCLVCDVGDSDDVCDGSVCVPQEEEDLGDLCDLR